MTPEAYNGFIDLHLRNDNELGLRGCKKRKKQTKMYAQKENKKLLNNAESGTKDITDEKSNNYQPLKYNMKKFKAFTKTGIEFLFAPSKEQAQKMFYQLYPCGDLQNLTEVEFTIY